MELYFNVILLQRARAKFSTLGLTACQEALCSMIPEAETMVSSQASLPLPRPVGLVATASGYTVVSQLQMCSAHKKMLIQKLEAKIGLLLSVRVHLSRSSFSR